MNRYKLSLYDNPQKTSNWVDSFRKYVEYATAFVKHAGQVGVFYNSLIGLSGSAVRD